MRERGKPELREAKPRGIGSGEEQVDRTRVAGRGGAGAWEGPPWGPRRVGGMRPPWDAGLRGGDIARTRAAPRRTGSAAWAGSPREWGRFSGVRVFSGRNRAVLKADGWQTAASECRLWSFACRGPVNGPRIPFWKKSLVHSFKQD